MPAEVDHFSSFGAGILAKRIETYWHERGHTAVRVERYDVFGDGATWGVRSNLVNGKPQQ